MNGIYNELGKRLMYFDGGTVRAVLFTANFFSVGCASRPEGFLIHRT